MGLDRVVYYPTASLVETAVRVLRRLYPEDYIVFIHDVNDILSAAKWCRLKAESARNKILWYATCLYYYFITGHPLSDGNKRCASLLLLWFLEKNGYEVIGDIYTLALNIALNKTSLEETYQWLKRSIRRQG